MKLIQRNPVSFSRELDDFFENLLASNLSRDDSYITTSAWKLAVDLKEEDNRYVVFADIPGVSPDDINVSVENNVLTISGERNHESKTNKDGYTRLEREHGSFNRQFKLPDTANSSDVVAKFNHGVLEVSIPKQEVSNPKRIQVKVNDN